MSETPNIYVSNGTCYFNQGFEADSSMIPCGNEFFAHATCCQANDTCLENSACYNAEYGVTYVAGCTDPDYGSSVCPDKYEDLSKWFDLGRNKPLGVAKHKAINDTSSLDSPTWMGMSYCNGTSNEWVLCNQPDDPSTIESPAACYCPTATSERTMTLSAASAITATAYLPSATGLEINYVAGHYPTSTLANTTPGSSAQQSTSRSQGLTTAATSTPPAVTSSTAQTASTSQSLGTDATIGIAVGASIGGVLLLSALGYFLHWLVLRRRRQQDADSANSKNISGKNPHESANAALGTIGAAQDGNTGNEEGDRLASARTSAVSELDHHPARPWSIGSEVDGTSAGRASSVVSPTRMESILEQNHGHMGPVELAANPVVELEG